MGTVWLPCGGSRRRLPIREGACMSAIRKSESFMRGALMLSLAALVSRLLGAFYKPIVIRIFAPFDGHNGNAGIGLTQVPLTAYMVILSFTSVGLNVGISRLVAERMALGDTRGARRVFRFSLWFMAVLGLVASLALWFGAPWIAALISKEIVDTIPGFRATAPALLVVSIMAAYRGLFQGFQYMTPNAYSQIIEQVVRVASGIVLTYFLVRHSVPLGAAGFNFGDVLGGLAGLAYLLVLVRRSGQDLWAATAEAEANPAWAGGGRQPQPVTLPNESPWSLIRRIFSVAGPITIVGAVVPLMMLADTFFVFRSMEAVGVVGNDAQAQYGLLTNVFMIVNLPAVFTTAIYTSILPSITEAMTLGHEDAARSRASQAYKVTTLIALPAQAGLFALATGLYAIIYGNADGGAAMAAMSWSCAAIMLQQTTSGVLQGIGKIGLPVRNFVLGAVVKVALTAWWTPIWGINGAAYATAVGFAAAAALNLYHAERLLGRTLEPVGMVLKPLAAALAMAGTLLVLQGPFLRAFPHPHLVTLILVMVGAAVYGIALLLVRGVQRREIEYLPRFGRPLANLLVRTGLLR